MATYTFVKLEVSQTTFDEIAGKLRLAGYEQAFRRDGDAQVIDMRGIAIVAEDTAECR